MHPVFEKYFSILLELFEYDLCVMSQPWMYYTIIPIIGYIIFFFLKWTVITAPMWLPITIIVGAARTKRKNKSDN